MRKLTLDERRLWDFVTQRVSPFHPRHHIEDTEPSARGVVNEHISGPPPFSPKPKHKQGPLHVGTAVDLDAATAKKFRKGRMPCDASLDLHDLTLAQAHAALGHFLRAQLGRGARNVRVITGKGAPDNSDGSDRPRGRIRAELIHWLNAAPLRQAILSVVEAGPRQGGSGAVYVFLKRRDKTRA
ncbi:MAG: hypothetical protein EXR11_08245 [Rhodospirillaceae bacterium]|nr:hypothetical protein [Rhodospirillaceae bacterium]